MSVWATRARYRIDNKMCLFTHPSNYIEWTRTITLKLATRTTKYLQVVKADDEFAAQNALSDAFLAGHFAARYGKYVPPPPPLPRPAHVEAASVELPIVENPVRVRDAPFKPPASKKAKR